MISLGKYRARLKRAYKEHFSLFLFVSLASLLGFSIFLMPVCLYFSVLTSGFLILVLVAYYYTYFSKFRILTDDYSPQKEYYYEAYSVWGVLAFNALFIFVFAHVGTVLSKVSPVLGFGEITFYGMLLFLVQAVIDGITFGILGSYSVNLSNIKMHGVFAQTYAYAANLTIDLAFIASIFSVVGEYLGTNREFKRIISSEVSDSDFFTTLSPAKVRAIVKHINSGKIDVQSQSEKIVNLLFNSCSKDARDIMLQVMQMTNNMDVYSRCVDYFKRNKDYRFKRICARVKDPVRLGILFEKGMRVPGKNYSGDVLRTREW
ncbi:hypothetical protein [Marinobacter sp. SS5-14b]|uniref:hypothetical protein n=1 Tax=Marinobacter sp. SS5-14b TaxID=3050456 RepID=UPI0026E0A948|nr:hypothetical protein [Marinobacter sp. SS5-14b]